MTENTRRHLKAEQVLGEWAVVAYASPRPHLTDGMVWLRGFDSEGQAKAMAHRLQEAMGQVATEGHTEPEESCGLCQPEGHSPEATR